MTEESKTLPEFLYLPMNAAAADGSFERERASSYSTQQDLLLSPGSNSISGEYRLLFERYPMEALVWILLLLFLYLEFEVYSATSF
jgi:hypothetical protein